MSDTQLKALKEVEVKMNETQHLLEQLINDGGEEKEKEFCVVSVESSQQSSVSPAHPEDTADKATDGDISTRSMTTRETAPWYSAELGGRFTAIRLNITQFTMHYAAHITLYTVDDGVETECATHITAMEDRWTENSWTVTCQDAGTGFKISAFPRPWWTTTPLILAEILVEVQQ